MEMMMAAKAPSLEKRETFSPKNKDFGRVMWKLDGRIDHDGTPFWRAYYSPRSSCDKNIQAADNLICVMQEQAKGQKGEMVQMDFSLVLEQEDGDKNPGQPWIHIYTHPAFILHRFLPSSYSYLFPVVFKGWTWRGPVLQD